ncbi:hypothetical protein [Coraliomargarita parva]|uniref:hypothetical protein n=1 Tax=Coraliomargarita parva TaxID=3014050 RepID=UPI0022B565BD|nr:hypothetical protein [Coraliomargarita parva]
MKPRPALLLVLLVAVCGWNVPVQAESMKSYVYNTSVLNWYQASEDRPAFAKYAFAPEGSPCPFTVEPHTSMLYVNIPKAVAANDDLVGASGGAIWAAPVGEQVQQVQLTYAGVLSPGLSLVVYGDSGNGKYDVEIGRVAPAATTDNRGTPASVVFAVPAATPVTKVKIRGYDLEQARALGAGWSVQIRAIQIATAPISGA